MGEHAGRPGLGEELAGFRARVTELQAAWVLPAEQRLQILESALFELRYAAEVLLPRAAASGADAGPGAAGERREEQLLRAVYQGLPLPVVLLDGEGTILRLNRAAAELVGVQAGYATGRPLAAFAAPGDRAGLRTQLAAAARGDGDRSRLVALLPGGRVQVTMVALRPPGEIRHAVLAVFQAPPPQVGQPQVAQPQVAQPQVAQPQVGQPQVGHASQPPQPPSPQVAQPPQSTQPPQPPQPPQSAQSAHPPYPPQVAQSPQSAQSAQPPQSTQSPQPPSPQVAHPPQSPHAAQPLRQMSPSQPSHASQLPQMPPPQAAGLGAVAGPGLPAATGETGRMLAEATRATLLLDVLDEAAAALLMTRQADPEQLLAALAGVLRGRIADWVIADLVTAGGVLQRCAVAAPVGPEPAELAAALESQDPASCPLAVAAAGGRTALQVRPPDVAGFGRDADGGAVIARAEVVSLLCLPVRDPVGGHPGKVRAVLTLFRSRGAGPASYAGEPFSLPEAGVLERVARHTALALGC